MKQQHPQQYPQQPYPQQYPQQPHPQQYPQQPHPQQYPQQPYAQQYPQQPYAQQPHQQPHGVPLAILAPRTRSVNDILPGYVPGLLGGLQLLLTVLIVILETVNVVYGPFHGTIYAGYWCSGIFFDTWVSMFCYLCCGKTSGCAIYLLVQNIFNLIFSIVIMALTNRFVNDPCYSYTYTCFSDISLLCCDADMIDKKLPVLKGLLACAVLMFLSNLAYIFTYIALAIWLHVKGKQNTSPMVPVYHQNTASVDIKEQLPDPAEPPPQYYRQSHEVRPKSRSHYHSPPTKTTPQREDDPSVEAYNESF